MILRNLISKIESDFDAMAYNTPRGEIEILADSFQYAYPQIGALKECLMQRYFEGVKAS